MACRRTRFCNHRQAVSTRDWLARSFRHAIEKWLPSDAPGRETEWSRDRLVSLLKERLSGIRVVVVANEHYKSWKDLDGQEIGLNPHGERDRMTGPVVYWSTDDLVAKREKKVAADDRKKFGPAAPKREKKSAADKETGAQRDGLPGGPALAGRRRRHCRLGYRGDSLWILARRRARPGRTQRLDADPNGGSGGQGGGEQ